MAGQKREREVERARHERQQARRSEEAHKRKQRQRVFISAGVAVVAVIGFGYLANAMNDDDSTVAEPTPTAEPSVDPSASGEPSPSTEPVVLDCAPVNETPPGDKQYDQPQDITLRPEAVYSVKLTTNCGEINIDFDPDAPENVASFIGLANDGFYDNTLCHRLTTDGIFVLQCGDPAGNGSGGPGYELPDENLPGNADNNYPAGTVAMANAGPGTGGSQFFLVYEDTTLPPSYTILGTMTSGLGLVQAVAAEGTADGSGDGAPKQPVQILTALTAETTEVQG